MYSTSGAILIAFLGLLSLTPAKKDLRAYYYQIEEGAPLVYKFVDQNDPTRVDYWRVTNFPETNRIVTESYDAEFTLYNIFEEEFNEDGAVVIANTERELQASGKRKVVKAKIGQRDIFKWSDKERYAYSLSFDSPSFGKYSLTKWRKFSGFKKVTIDQELYKTCEFTDHYESDFGDENPFTWYQHAYYAKGVGMVKREIYYKGQKPRIMELKAILSDADWQQIILDN